ncbi:MAG: GNAT family N-acetyltransferase [Candidatus Hodarchaeota archaeon]
MRIKQLEETHERSSIVAVWKKMWQYLNPDEPVLSEEVFDAILARENQTVLSHDFLIAEDSQNSIIGFAGLLKSSTRVFWRVMNVVLPEYIKSSLPGKLFDAIITLAKKQAAPKLRFYSRGHFIPFNRKLEKMGIKPVQYGWWMHLDDFKSLPQSSLPPNITLQKQKDIDDLVSYVAVYNKIFSDGFEFEPRTEEKTKQFFEQMQKIHDIEHLFAIEGNKLVGICFISINPEQEVKGTINSLGVLPSYRRLGIGSALLTFGIQSLREKGCEIIELSVMANDEKALALYRKFGFYKLELQTQYIFDVYPPVFVDLP